MVIKISSEGYETTVQECDSWDETKERIVGAVHRVTLARDFNKDVVGVIRI